MNTLIIIGGGPAGLTSAIYSKRAGLDTLLIEKEPFLGGIPFKIPNIENYPGFPDGISGERLSEMMTFQVKNLGVKIVNECAKKIIIKKDKIVVTDKNEYAAKSIIIATGCEHKKLNIPGEDEFFGKGVSYCAICDAPLFKNKTIAIVGCGNSGIQEGLFLLNYVKNIIFIELLPQMTADHILQRRIKNKPNVDFYFEHKLEKILGDEVIKSIIIKNIKTEKKKEIPVDGVFIYVGFKPNTEFVKNILKLNKNGFIITNERLEASVNGIFAAGDVREKELRQITTAIGDGALAAYGVQKYILESIPVD